MSKAQTVREKVEKIAKDFDAVGFGGAAPTKPKRAKSAYQDFVAKHRKGNKHSMSEISAMWREKQGKSSGSKTAKKPSISAKKIPAGPKGTLKKRLSSSEKPKRQRKSKVVGEDGLEKVKGIMAKAKENGIKFSKDEKGEILKNHGVSAAQYKASKPTISKEDLKKKLLSKKKN